MSSRNFMNPFGERRWSRLRTTSRPRLATSAELTRIQDTHSSASDIRGRDSDRARCAYGRTDILGEVLRSCEPRAHSTRRAPLRDPPRIYSYRCGRVDDLWEPFWAPETSAARPVCRCPRFKSLASIERKDMRVLIALRRWSSHGKNKRRWPASQAFVARPLDQDPMAPVLRPGQSLGSGRRRRTQCRRLR
jgi:hypothetical protein